MKKIILVAIGAKFIHASLALRYLSRFADNDQRHQLVTMEFTINQRPDFILNEIFMQKPDVIMFSCYIWNIELIKQLMITLKKILPQTSLMLGGPEVSYNSEDFLRKHQEVALIMRGEGELTITELLDHLDFGAPSLADIAGITYREDKRVVSTPERPPLDLSLLPFPYDHDQLETIDKIIYYESSRGCPYHCAYCLSSIEKGVRFLPLDKIFAELDRFLAANVRQVKFIDRTFNCNKKHTMAIWRYLAQHDNGVTNFHFELTADLLDEEMIAFLQTLRKGFFQFEIGVQSTNPQTMAAIHRQVNFERLAKTVKKIHCGGNIHQHLDLIAGLPNEDYDSFGRSFNDVYQLAPEQLQLGFLKVLEGTYLAAHRQQWGIIFRDYAPYEVLATNMLTPEDVFRLKRIEEMVETYYNSGKFIQTLDYIVPFYDNPFAFYEKLGDYWQTNSYHYRSNSKLTLCDILYQFIQQNNAIDETIFKWRLKFDLCLHEKPKKLPQWLNDDLNSLYRTAIVDFYRHESRWIHYLPHYRQLDSKIVERRTHLEIFPDGRAVLFDYDHKDLLANARFWLLEHWQDK